MKKLAATFLLGAIIFDTPVAAQNSPEASAETSQRSPLEMRSEQVVSILNGDLSPEEVFTEGFLAQVPSARLAAISQQWIAQYGAALSVETVGNPDGVRSSLAIRMEKAIARGGLAIDPSDDNRISELVFQNFEALDDSPAKIVADLEALPGDVSYYFGPLDGSDPVMRNAEDPQMPLGSTFKLYILAALAREVAEGRRDWGDVVALSDTRSFPSGMMQDWPKGAEVTLETLASLMISISDNTATDALISALGRETVEQAVIDSGHSEPSLNIPFLTTREMFLLKSGPEERLTSYQSGNAEMRRQVLDGIEIPPMPTSEVQASFSGGPVALDVEWFASAADLAGLFAFMRQSCDPRAFEIMAINSSVAAGTSERWPYAGYKGGSEPGVLNLTWLLTDADGRDHLLVLSWRNDTENIELAALNPIAQRILNLPR